MSHNTKQEWEAVIKRGVVIKVAACLLVAVATRRIASVQAALKDITPAGWLVRVGRLGWLNWATLRGVKWYETK